MGIGEGSEQSKRKEDEEEEEGGGGEERRGEESRKGVEERMIYRHAHCARRFVQYIHKRTNYSMFVLYLSVSPLRHFRYINVHK